MRLQDPKEVNELQISTLNYEQEGRTGPDFAFWRCSRQARALFGLPGPPFPRRPMSPPHFPGRPALPLGLKML